VSPVRYELSFYTPEDGILHNHRRENLKSYILKANFLKDQFNIIVFLKTHYVLVLYCNGFPNRTSVNTAVSTSLLSV
jgi:hypothetical protein